MPAHSIVKSVDGGEVHEWCWDAGELFGVLLGILQVKGELGDRSGCLEQKINLKPFSISVIQTCPPPKHS